MAEPEAVWRVCRVIKGDCDFCPASEMVGGGACTRSCLAQAVECINTVETGNPWRKTEGVKAPWISASPAPEGGEEEGGLGSASASGDDGAVSFAAANHEAAPPVAEAASPALDREQMAEFLGLPKRGEERERILDAIGPEEWAQHEAFAVQIEAIKRWDRGEGPLPAGVIACGRRRGK